MTIPALVMFDLDGTLTESKQPLTSEMAVLLAKLLEHTSVAVISGGALSQFLKQVVAQLPVDTILSKLYLLPTSGAALYEFKNDNWRKVYEERLSEKEKEVIEIAMHEAAAETKVIDFSKPATFGERIEYRGGQVSISALGQQAPIELKKEWDPDKSKRRALQTAIAARLPDFSVGMGGATTIDVTKRNIDKAYGTHQLCRLLGIKESNALYVGDELQKGGNDEALFKTGAKTHAVSSPAETALLIASLVSGTTA